VLSGAVAVFVATHLRAAAITDLNRSMLLGSRGNIGGNIHIV
jgi:hypothetical protein